MKLNASSLATDRNRVRGLGSAKAGTKHFWHQRVSAVALIPLTLFFIVTLIKLSGANYQAALGTVGRPFFALVLIGFVLAGAYHMRLGMQVVIEDYIHGEVTKLVLLMFNTFFSAFVALASLYAIVRISLGN